MKRHIIIFLCAFLCILHVLPIFAVSEIKTADAEVSDFADISGHWAEEYILKAAEYGLVKGDGNGSFNPDGDVTRAQFVTILSRIKGIAEEVSEAPFSDIENLNSEFKTAISWGYKNGYIKGISETSFDPDGKLSREAAMKILYEYAGGKSGKEMLLTSVYDGLIKDSTEISLWAKPAMYWSIYNKLISGTEKNTFSPKSYVTRAQLSKILVNYIEIFEKVEGETEK